MCTEAVERVRQRLRSRTGGQALLLQRSQCAALALPPATCRLLPVARLAVLGSTIIGVLLGTSVVYVLHSTYSVEGRAAQVSQPQRVSAVSLAIYSFCQPTPALCAQSPDQVWRYPFVGSLLLAVPGILLAARLARGESNQIAERRRSSGLSDESFTKLESSEVRSLRKARNRVLDALTSRMRCTRKSSCPSLVPVTQSHPTTFLAYVRPLVGVALASAFFSVFFLIFNVLIYRVGFWIHTSGLLVYGTVSLAVGAVMDQPEKCGLPEVTAPRAPPAACHCQADATLSGVIVARVLGRHRWRPREWLWPRVLDLQA